MAVQTANVAAGVYRLGEMPLLMAITVASQATITGLLTRQRFETNDLANVPATFHMLGSGTVTGLAAVPVLKGGLEMRRVFKILFVKVLVTPHAGIRPNVLGGFVAGRRGVILLATSKARLKREQ
jgi:hypothetical protein